MDTNIDWDKFWDIFFGFVKKKKKKRKKEVFFSYAHYYSTEMMTHIQESAFDAFSCIFKALGIIILKVLNHYLT